MYVEFYMIELNNTQHSMQSHTENKKYLFTCLTKINSLQLCWNYVYLSSVHELLYI